MKLDSHKFLHIIGYFKVKNNDINLYFFLDI